MKILKENYQIPTADVIILNINDIITASDPYVEDIAWDL